VSVPWRTRDRLGGEISVGAGVRWTGGHFQSRPAHALDACSDTTVKVRESRSPAFAGGRLCPPSGRPLVGHVRSDPSARHDGCTSA
jgi:hypothetical protein